MNVVSVPCIQLAKKMESLISQPSYANLYKMDFSIDGETKVLLSSDILYKRLANYHYDQDYVFAAEEKEYMSIKEVLDNYFNIAWSDYKAKNYDNYKKSFIAILKEYNPLDNYDRYEDSSTAYDGSELDVTQYDGTVVNELKKEGTEISESNYGSRTDSSVNEVSPFNGNIASSGNSYVPESKISNTIGAKQDGAALSFSNRKDTNSQTFNNRSDARQKTFNNRQDITTSHIHGNIGVTTSMQMLNQELDGRMRNLADMVIDEFVNLYCTYLSR